MIDWKNGGVGSESVYFYTTEMGYVIHTRIVIIWIIKLYPCTKFCWWHYT